MVFNELSVCLCLCVCVCVCVQATRVTRACHILKDTATEIRSRPLLYTNTPQLELDSLLLLTHCVRLRVSCFSSVAKLFLLCLKCEFYHSSVALYVCVCVCV